MIQKQESDIIGFAAGVEDEVLPTEEDFKKKGGKKKKITLKKGALTKQAKSHGYKDVMKFARLTMRLHKQGKKTYPNGKRITKLLVKRSNFAVNFNKKK